MTLRSKIARWLDPEMAARSDAADEAELRAFELTAQVQRCNNQIDHMRGELSGLTNANDVIRDANIKLQLHNEETAKTYAKRVMTILIQRAALERALPYVLDAEDDITDKLDGKVSKACRVALEATLAAVRADIEQVSNALNAGNAEPKA